MTIPLERTASVIAAEQFLCDLTNPKLTPRVPKAVRATARRLLRHYPSASDLHFTNIGWGNSLVGFVGECPFASPKETW